MVEEEEEDEEESKEEEEERKEKEKEKERVEKMDLVILSLVREGESKGEKKMQAKL